MNEFSRSLKFQDSFCMWVSAVGWALWQATYLLPFSRRRTGCPGNLLCPVQGMYIDGGHFLLEALKTSSYFNTVSFHSAIGQALFRIAVLTSLGHEIKTLWGSAIADFSFFFYFFI